MKALLHGGAGLLGLLLFGSVSFGYVLVSPVFKQPYPQAPSLFNTAPYYTIDPWGRVVGPCYYLVPPCQPFNGILPGQTGQAIMSGNLPHTLLLSKEGLVIGKVPMIGQKQGPPDQGNPAPNGAYMSMGGANQGPPAPPMAPMPNMQIPYGYVPPMQIPHGYVPPMQPMQSLQPMPYPIQTQRPGQIAYNYPMSTNGYANYYDPRLGVYQAQAPGAQPFSTIPGFAPNLPPTPATPALPTMPMMPVPPGGAMGPMPNYGPAPNFGPGPNNGFNYFTPLQPMNPMAPPMSPMSPLQLPRMEGTAPPPMKVGGNAYPTHPFVRSPRDFFMWGESIQDEMRSRNRPFPVP